MPSEPQEDQFEHWVESILRGDSNAFGQFYDAYTFRLFRLALLLTRGNEDLAREVHQISMIKAARHFRRFRNPPELWPWLSQIARHTFVDLVRKESFLARLRSMLIRSTREDQPAPDEERAFQCLERALATLGSEDAALLQSAYFENKTQKEMALHGGRTPKAVERRLARLRQQLRAILLKELKHE